MQIIYDYNFFFFRKICFIFGYVQPCQISTNCHCNYYTCVICKANSTIKISRALSSLASPYTLACIKREHYITHVLNTFI